MPKALETVKAHLRYVDSLRGYAILLVITCHLTYSFSELPYPVSRFTSLGWYGVQLFFMMSAFTLLSSWHSERQRTGSINVLHYFIRRYLRIAPAYYLGAAIYYFVRPPIYGFDLTQLAGSLFFIHGWHPNLMTTVPDKWMVVPGGWSIGVEFAFYALFPIVAAFVTSFKRAVVAVILSLVVGAACNRIAFSILSETASETAVTNFLYFWLPNQAPAFLTGFMIYYLIGAGGKHAERVRQIIMPFRYALAAFSVLLFLSATFIPMSHFLGQNGYPSEVVFISIPLLGFVLAVASGPSLFVNRATEEMGKVSFSAYLLHFAVLDLLEKLPWAFGLDSTRYAAIAWYVIDWVLVVAFVFFISSYQYKFVELPMMNLAKRLTRPSAEPQT